MKNFGGRCLLLVTAASLPFLPASYGQNATENPQTKAAEPSAKELPQPMAYDKAFPIAKGYADTFLNGTGGGSCRDKMTREMQQALGNDRTKWEVMAGGIGQQIGKVTETVNEGMLPALQLQVYTRLIRTDAFPGRLMVTIALTSDGKITGLSGRPEGNPAESKFLEYKDKNTYSFPLTGEWTIYQGGRSVYDNYHAAAADERFAYDIVAFRDGSMYKDGATSLEMFYGFGQPVVAAAAGKVAVAEDKYDDNVLGKPSDTAPKQGNNVVIDHGNGEFTMYAHLKRGSVKVKAGDAVKAGQQIAEVGNSGQRTAAASAFPHAEYGDMVPKAKECR